MLVRPAPTRPGGGGCACAALWEEDRRAPAGPSHGDAARCAACPVHPPCSPRSDYGYRSGVERMYQGTDGTIPQSGMTLAVSSAAEGPGGEQGRGGPAAAAARRL